MLGRGGILLCPRGFPAVTVRLKLRDGAAKSPCTCGLVSEIYKNQSYFDYYRKQKKRISDEVGRLRNETNDSRQYLNKLLCDLVFSNDLLIVRLWKLFFAILVAAEARTAEYRLKQLEEANREIAKQSKHIMASSKTVGTDLRNKGDLDAVLASLNCFESEVSRSVEEINNIMCNRARIERESER